ncbi:MAG: hypothetical protein LBG11_00620 [Bifidobacteriaceae bacterium]|nr:hypothetical protein [Bifidobacteriaceae bacterium]
MAALTIRNLDDQVYAELKEAAKASGRSMEAEARRTLTSVYGGRGLGEALIALGEDFRREFGGIELPEPTAFEARVLQLDP